MGPSRMHVATWAFDDGCNGGIGASTGFVRAWVTFAESDCGPHASKAQRDCHAGRRRYCLVMQYLDSDWNYAQAPVVTAPAGGPRWFLHEPRPNQATPIFSAQEGGGLLINQFNQSARAFFRSYVRAHYNHDDGLMMDEQSPSLGMELYYANCGCATTAEIRSNRTLQIGHGLMSAALTHTTGSHFVQADNSLPPNPFIPQGLHMLNRRQGVDGLIAEGEPDSYGNLDPYYSTLLDQIAYVTRRTAGFVVLMPHGSNGAPYQQTDRVVQEATVLLGFVPGRVVDWDNLEEGSTDLEIFPEEGIVPAAPLQSMHAPGGRGCLDGTGVICRRGGHHNLQVAPGVYRREFGGCYYRGAPFGACAAFVNTTGAWVGVRSSWIHRDYHHMITLNGGDVQSGGTISIAGATFVAGATQIPPDGALLLSP
jgi:hypothetical protein